MSQKPFSSPVAKILKDYRTKYNLSQEQLAHEMSIDVRTLRRYEHEETILTDVLELRRVAGVLGIEPERFGVLPGLASPEELDAAIDHIWTLARLARYPEAHIVVDRLITATASGERTDQPAFLRQLAKARHAAGYISGQMARANEAAGVPYGHYHEMELLARELGDASLLNIALSYEGDMLQRAGQIEKAIAHLEEARDSTPDADSSARGNGIQLLGRAYFKAERLGDFERAMHEAEELAYQPHAGDFTTTVRGQFGAGTVYEEWGRSLGLLGQTQKALDYLDKAEAAFSQTWTTQRRDMLMLTARAMVLVRSGEIQAGATMALEAVILCKKHGNIRLLDRIYGIQQYLSRLSREVSQVSGTLNEALYGPVEY